MPQSANVCIGIIGATGNVGRNITELIIKRNLFPKEQIRLFASAASAGKIIDVNNTKFIVEDAAKSDFNDCQIAILATDSDISKKYIPQLLEKNIWIIDSSSLYRLNVDTPLIVAPVNKQLVSINTSRLYAIANCVASPIALTLAPLHKYSSIKRVVVTTFQSTSGAGKGPMDELYNETRSKFEEKNYPRKYFKHPIAFNIIPQIDKFLEDGSTFEEFKITHEVQKILQVDFPINVTAVRVPVFIGHSASIAIEFNNEINLEEIFTVLGEGTNLKISNNNYSTPIEVVGSDDVYIGRIRRDNTVANGINLWICSDNLHRGAATDAVEVAEEIVKQLNARGNQP